MRIRLVLRPLERHCRIPINYQYPIAGAIYKILAAASPEYAQWLHDKGYSGHDSKPSKLFVFSRLSIAEMSQQGKVLIAHNHSPCAIEISSPKLEDFVQNFVTGVFAKQEISIGNDYAVGRFVIEEIMTIAPPPLFSLPLERARARFRCLSPVVVSTMQEHNGKLSSHYLRPDDPRFADAIRHNLARKLTMLTGSQATDGNLEFHWDEDYIDRKGGYDRISKLIWIQEGNDERESKIKAFIAPFEMTGNTELLYVAYECGIGEKNSLGFGMVDVLE